MASDRQINANRKNSEKCCGPRSAAGKAISSQNALKTGLDAKSEVIRTENRADYEALTAEYYARFHPTVPEERRLVDILIASEWLGRRYLRADAATWEQRFEDTKCQLVGKIFNERSAILIRVDRRINSANRNFQLALNQLRKIQAEHDQSVVSEPRLEGAVLEPTEPTETPSPDVATEPLTPELVSSLTPVPKPQPEAKTPETLDPGTEEDPPIAA